MEYKIEQLLTNTRESTDLLNQLAAKGWRVVPGTFTINSGRYVVLMEKEEKRGPGRPRKEEIEEE